jgi:crotonobetainyl-CoA:carnitine CoA-transferase CaiB-like acyl-CoA transferase
LNDLRFADNQSRTRNHAHLDPLLREHFLTRPRAHWLNLLSAAGVPCAPVSNVAEVAQNPHLLERKMVLPADHPTYHRLLVPGSPLKSVGDDAAPPTRAPELGEHTETVLRNLLGYSQATMAELRERGII